MKKKIIIRTLWGINKEDINEKHIYYMHESFSKSFIESTANNKKQINDYICDNLNHFLVKNRLEKIYSNVERSLKEPFKFNFVCYTFGIKNHEKLLNMGINSKLIDEFPNPYFYYRHKLEAIKHAMMEYDEILFLDWDSFPVREIDDNIWEILGSRGDIQLSLSKYSHARLNHRNGRENKYCPSGSFIYLKDKKIIDKLIEDMRQNKMEVWSEEPSLARITYEIMGGWDLNKFHNKFETTIYKKDRRDVFQKEDKNIYFRNRCNPHRY